MKKKEAKESDQFFKLSTIKAYNWTNKSKIVTIQ